MKLAQERRARSYLIEHEHEHGVGSKADERGCPALEEEAWSLVTERLPQYVQWTAFAGLRTRELERANAEIRGVPQT